MPSKKATRRNDKENPSNALSGVSLSGPAAHFLPPVGSAKNRKKPLQRRAQQTVAVILQAAKEVFVQLGFAGATTNKIAERAGVSIGSLYQYYPNKTSILLHLFEQQILGGASRIEQAIANLTSPETSLHTGLCELVREVVALHELSPRLRQVLFAEVARMPDMRAFHAEAEARNVAFTESILAQIPGVRQGDHHLMAYFLVQTTEALAHWIVMDAPPDIDRETSIEETAELLYRYVM